MSQVSTLENDVTSLQKCVVQCPVSRSVNTEPQSFSSSFLSSKHAEVTCWTVQWKYMKIFTARWDFADGASLCPTLFRFCWSANEALQNSTRDSPHPVANVQPEKYATSFSLAEWICVRWSRISANATILIWQIPCSRSSRDSIRDPWFGATIGATQYIIPIPKNKRFLKSWI